MSDEENESDKKILMVYVLYSMLLGFFGCCFKITVSCVFLDFYHKAFGWKDLAGTPRSDQRCDKTSLLKF